jgi:hypothetical protein
VLFERTCSTVNVGKIEVDSVVYVLVAVIVVGVSE